MEHPKTIGWALDAICDLAEGADLGWSNKWQCAVDMAARAELERDELRAALIRLHDAVTNRMTADEPTREDTLELLRAWKNAANFIPQNDQVEARRK